MPDEISRQQVNATGKRKWIYAQEPGGLLYTYRGIVSFFLLGVFFSLPFLKINGHQALQFDIINLKFAIFGIILWPQDFFIFALVMIATLLIIAVVTLAVGRVFCGWICPQTIFMEMVFRKIEYLIEGNPNQQRNLNRGPTNAIKVFKKTLKHSIFFLISFVVANTFLSYIIGIVELKKIIKDPIQDHIGGFIAITAFSCVFYVIFAYVRELVCIVLCPYGRLQGVLIDKQTVVITYDYERGEPRGLNKGQDSSYKGDCIDCYQCVKVCPTGIDIRNGLQLECVNCAACIDACNNIMEKLKRPKNLIKYASKENIINRTNPGFSFRMLMSLLLLVLSTTIITAFIVSKGNLDVIVDRVGGSSYEISKDNKEISNLYRLKIVNKKPQEIDLNIQIPDYEGARIQLIATNKLRLTPEGISEIFFFIYIPKNYINKRLTKIRLQLISDRGHIEKTIKTNFIGPLIFKNHKLNLDN
ncbi:MAG: cytochrome c oxidase accessory protein CcoG [Solitalea-like symbiont of Tyrophagus putrescentiae]